MKTVKKCSTWWGVRLVIALVLMGMMKSVALDDKFTIHENCQLVSSKGNDGDSFKVRLENGDEKVFRLYGVDCIERNDEKKYMKLRLTEQAYYFGVYGKLGKRRNVTLMRMGDAATNETKRLIGRGRKFTVVTRYRDARGVGKRYFAYLFINDLDLSKELVRLGLARVYGLVDDLPDLKAGGYWRELEDAQMMAIASKNGIWSQTDWKKFPNERAKYWKLLEKR